MIYHSNLSLKQRKRLEREAAASARSFPSTLKKGDVVKIKALGYYELAKAKTLAATYKVHEWPKTYNAKFIYAKKEPVEGYFFKFKWVGYFELETPIESPTTSGLYITHVWRYVHQVYL